MSSPSNESPEPRIPQKASSWTPAKIAVLVVVILVAAAGAGYGISRVIPSSPSSPVPPDFSFVSSAQSTSQVGSTSQETLTITPTNGFTSGVSFTFSAPAGLSCNAPNPSATFATTAQYSCKSDSAGTYLLTITASSGSTSHSITVSFTFEPPSSVIVTGKATVTGAAATTIEFSTCGFDTSVPGYLVCLNNCVIGPGPHCAVSAAVDSNGYYSLSLQNPGTYAIRIDTSASSCLAGSLLLNQNSVGSVTDNYSCSVLKTTSTSIVCDAATVVVNLTYTTCTITVTDTSSASVPVSGTVTVTAPNRWWANPITCQTTSSEVCKLTGVGAIIRPSSGTLTLTANYAGDSVHAASSAEITLTVNSPPVTVTVSGTATTNSGCVGCTVSKLEFIDQSSSLTFTALVSSGSYSISLTNLKTYTVIVYWSGTFGSGSCTSSNPLSLFSPNPVFSQDYFFANGQC